MQLSRHEWIRSGPVAFLFIAAAALASPSAGILFGVTPGMDKQRVVHQLEKVGHLRAGQTVAAKKQYWILSDRRYSYAVARFDNGNRLKWISAYTRRGGAPLLFSEVGDRKAARLAGRYIYVWSVPARAGKAGHRVIARSLDPDTVQSLSVTELSSSSGTAASQDSLR